MPVPAWPSMIARPSGTGGLTERARLLARDSVELFRAENFRAQALVDVMALVGDQTVGGAEHLPLGLEDARRRIARDGAVGDVREADDLRPGQNLFDEGPSLGLALDLLGKAAVEVTRTEGRALLGRDFDDGSGIAFVDRVAKLVGFFATGADDPPALIALVGFGPT